MHFNKCLPTIDIDTSHLRDETIVSRCSLFIFALNDKQSYAEMFDKRQNRSEANYDKIIA